MIDEFRILICATTIFSMCNNILELQQILPKSALLSISYFLIACIIGILAYIMGFKIQHLIGNKKERKS